MEDFTITHIGDTALSLPMPFKFIPVKDKTFMFQASDGSNLSNKAMGVPITFENGFWICAYQTTQEFWEIVINASNFKSLKPNPSYFKGNTRPVEQVSWDDIQIFNTALNKLFQDENLTFENGIKGKGVFGLPSETQWEHTAEAGQGLVFSGSQSLSDVGWYKENSNDQTMPVGQKHSNALGLYDMSGNVWEWCADDYTENISEIPKNGQPNLKKDQYKVLRGGSYFGGAGNCRLRGRGRTHPGNRNYGIGFRLGFSPSSVHES